MSGIYGIFHKNNRPVTPHDLAPIAERLALWGPDGHGQWVDGAVGLGHFMLHTTPESFQEQLPTPHPQLPDLVITADAWLDNRAELFTLLNVDRAAQATMTDSTLILLAYVKWGSACAEKLLGDFAFVIWDGRRQQLFCARDIFGNKPLLYYADSHHFIFASEINALLAHPAVPKQLNEPLLAAYLQQQTFNAQKRYTFWEQIVKLPSAHTLTVNATATHMHAYWSPEDAPEVRLPNGEAYAEALRELLHQAVACRLRTPFAVGAHLSGGLDSSTVAILAARQLRQAAKPITTFSWSPPLHPDETNVTDERRIIEAICAEEGLRCQYFTLNVNDVLAIARRDVTTEPNAMIWREEPVQQQAQAQGLRVLLSGWGGDEVISMHAHHYLAELVTERAWRQLYAELIHRVPARGDRLGPLRQAKGWGTHLYRFALLPLLSEPLWLRLTGRKPGRPYSYSCIEPTFARRHQVAAHALRDKWAREQPQLHATQCARLNMGHLTRRLEDWTTNGARHHLVYRYPLLDRRIVEFGLGVPSAQLCRQGNTRALMRRAGEGILPAAMPWHPSKHEPAATTIMAQTYRQLFPRWLDLVLSQPYHPNVTQYVQVARLKEVRKKVDQIELHQLSGIQNALSCFSIQQLN
jgi:asparagine synthase (glutamine-hydrolysing)